MKFRIPRRALLAFVAVFALMVAVPAMASAAAPSLTVTPSNLQAGGSPTMAIDSAWLAPGANTDTPSSVEIDFAPGLLANANANPSCLVTANTTLGGPCQIGTGTLHATVAPAVVDTPVPVNLYLAPAANAATQLGVIDIVIPAPFSLTVAAPITVTATGSLVLTAALPNASLGSPATDFTGLDITLNPTLNGNPFNRLPSSCGAATSTLKTTFYGSTAAVDTTGAFTPTGCSTLPFSPVLTATATKDTSDSNVAVTTDVAQTSPAGQAADQILTLTVPSALSPNPSSAAAVQNKGTAVGTASATSPLIPLPLTGTVTLTGTTLSPILTITFPAPFPLVLQGAVNLLTSAVTFSNVPDVPLSDLRVTLNGGPQGLYETSCNPSSGPLLGSFTGQNGATTTSNSTLAVTGCSTTTTPPPPPPTIGAPTTSGTSLAGLVKNKGKLGVTVAEGTNAKPIKTIAISLPSGISFSSKAKNLKKGIVVKGAGKFTYKVSHGVLTITLKSPATKAKVTLESPAISVTAKLAKKVKAELKKHKATALSVKVKVTDSGATKTTITLKLKPKS